MRIKTTREINATTQDGRSFAADEGTVVEIDDEDAALVGLAKSLIMSGQAEHYGDVGEAEDSTDGTGQDDIRPDPEDDAGNPVALDDEDDLEDEDDEG